MGGGYTPRFLARNRDTYSGVVVLAFFSEYHFTEPQSRKKRVVTFFEKEYI
jgi:hypothetical protein